MRVRHSSTPPDLTPLVVLVCWAIVLGVGLTATLGWRAGNDAKGTASGTKHRADKTRMHIVRIVVSGRKAGSRPGRSR